ncbi:DNA-binding protein Ikaros-like [Anopheles ziemanni]|uniref:DNA-binding protein Ikaros-like n=1 Tax=Anopheles coustani TaxID=139045 RepID=UPI00265A0993|nr:DNA-binding protein Ikaros-like [Anopheles coustani]XP_058173262.1 DNA-binding protein Ikaros-like [Anopheles ziemanni]
MSEVNRKCRLCLRQADVASGSTITDKEFQNMMSCVFFFWIPNGYALPKSVCRQCYLKIRDFYDYSKVVQANQEILNREYDNHLPVVEQDLLPEAKDMANEEGSDDDCQQRGIALDIMEVKMEPMPASDDDSDFLCNASSVSGMKSEYNTDASNLVVAKTETRTRDKDKVEGDRNRDGNSLCRNQGGLQKVECPVCKKMFGYHYIKHHFSSHLSPLQCELCGKSFAAKKNLTRHRQVTHGFAKKLSIYDLIPT